MYIHRHITSLLQQAARSTGWLLIIAVFMIATTQTANAALLGNIDSIRSGNPWYDPNATCAQTTDVSLSTTGPNTGNADNNKGSWNSGLQPPYILEQFMIEVLKDVAQKRSAPPTDAVTEEHVVALVAFAMGEGGDINNRDLFNPLNTGINAPDLLATAHNTSGVQSFKSFDAGVEANARVMTGKLQSRLSDVLIQKGSTAADFMKALTYFKNYEGNKLWAEASIPSSYNNFDKQAPEKYYRSRLQLVKNVRSNYKNTAGLVVGTPAKEQPEHITEPSKLQFKPGGGEGDEIQLGATVNNTDGTDSTSACDSSSDQAASLGNGSLDAIKNTILKFAWPDYRPAGSGNAMEMKPEYVQALKKKGAYAGSCNGVDCGAFVTTVMRESGADPTYNPTNGPTGTQLHYLEANSGSGKKYTHLKDLKALQFGDIAVHDGHTFIYVGAIKDSSGKRIFNGDSASASQCQRAPMAGPTDTPSRYQWFRLNTTTNTPTEVQV